MAASIRKRIRVRLGHHRDSSFRCSNHRRAGRPGLKLAIPNLEALSCPGYKPRVTLKVPSRAVALQAINFQHLSFQDHSSVAPYSRDRTLPVPRLLGRKSVVPNFQARQLPALSLRSLSNLEASSPPCSAG